MNKLIPSTILASLALSAADIPVPPQAQDATASARVLYVHEGDINTLHCRALTDCLVEAPKGEQFIRVTLGDAERWRDSKDSLPSRFYSIKPAYNGISTTLHLYTDHDNEYGFKVDETRFVDPDYTTILKTDDGAITARITAPSMVVSREQYELAEKHATAAEAALIAAKADTSKQVTAAVMQVSKNLPAQMRSYAFDKNKAKDRPWEISEILADDKFTYLRRSVKANDLPSVYAVGENGKPEIVVPHYDPDRDIYVIAQRINDGYLSFGGQKKEKKLLFHLP